MDDFNQQLELLLADRHSPEAAALFQTLLKYVHNRVRSISYRTPELRNPVEAEEVVADVLFQLMSGGLHRFRGGSMPELIGFVRTITDRCTWRAVRKGRKERANIADMGDDGLERLPGNGRRADSVEVLASTALPLKDQEYLLDLMRAGSKAELARRAGVSRAAVTQRIQRIRKRVSALSIHQRDTHDAWLHQAAARVLME
jgi:DNA-directed RNA polymerase specialized sigma24 family protein